MNLNTKRGGLGRTQTSRALKKLLKASEERGRLKIERATLFLSGTKQPAQQIYTDGSCPPKGVIGGWGFCVVRNSRIIHEASGGSEQTTTNRMELQAILEAMHWTVSNSSLPTIILSDSQYSVNAISTWMWEWELKGWRSKEGNFFGDVTGSVKNRDIFEAIMRILREWSGVFRLGWVRGHSGNAYNDYADRLATSATKATRMHLIMRRLKK